ncbi:hypothetical protein HL666_13380 [Bradyrhizobium sp. 83002]|uniref:hypothetical protein n=1 Tax=Bradyrhizobium aeschynomenes TaxID=2734909 RepID=UPI0015548B2E|nr:hypothetical protein [Bradyrhizobium aeschynomenes]NPU11758.1 hypothetical protein [Bradyrhizobium aeschynomenes]NPV22327.1 hypothetical protein [Bradyrhizobium aeschynomenes]
MTTNLDADGGQLQPLHNATLRWLALPVWAPLLLLFAAGILMRHLVASNTDVSWLLIAGERWLDGQRLYSEIMETNPPMAVLVYVPAILIARGIGVPAELVLDVLLFVAIASSLAVSMLILRDSAALAPRQRWPLALITLAVLAVLPAQCFGQREHIAVIELVPALAMLALRINRETPPFWASAVAGAGLGLALCFKPHFALAMLCVLGVVAVHLRSARLLLAPENLIAALLVSVYSLCTVLLFPEFFSDMWPVLRDVYSIGLPLPTMIAKPAILLYALTLVATLLLKRSSGVTPTLMLLLSASAAFLMVYLLQRKGWPYHSYPMLAFALLGFFYAVTAAPSVQTGAPAQRGLATWVVGAALLVPALVWFNRALDARFLQPAIARLGIAHPTIMVVSGDPGIPHPLTRAVGGVWASREQCLLASSYEEFARDSGADAHVLARLDPYTERERRWLADDIRRSRPSIVLVDNLTGDWGQWLHASPELDRLMQSYRRTETVQDIDIYVREPE